MSRTKRSGYYFGAGPAALPEAVLHQAESALLNWNDSGVSILEIGHRSPPFTAFLTQAENNLRELLSIPENYRVLFLGGAARTQFSMIPMNLLSKQQGKAAYIISGLWSSLGFEEAKRFGQAYAIKPDEACKSNTAYVYYTPNETVDGMRLAEIPDTGDIPLIADMTSCLLSEVIDVNKFGLIFAGAQKNIGPAGLTVVIVRDDLLAIKPKYIVPTMLDYRVHAKHHSLYATPPVFQCYMAAKMFEWVQAQGGVKALENINIAKAARLYAYIDGSSYYQAMVDDVALRSRMNVCFSLKNKTDEAAFLDAADARGLRGLKGHRLKGGMRASLYNAMPMDGVDALIKFMDEFSRDVH
ncbi:MAG: 3-phosphoserine/phosphohydroxythreonine transaminase [Legionellaceae bacterium]|nr:3-phosphoserine/phosphohydroxythreonine transaminase [Legionellaceae bacterium]